MLNGQFHKSRLYSVRTGAAVGAGFSVLGKGDLDAEKAGSYCRPDICGPWRSRAGFMRPYPSLALTRLADCTYYFNLAVSRLARCLQKTAACRPNFRDRLYWAACPYGEPC